jgi:hypothetical protein
MGSTQSRSSGTSFFGLDVDLTFKDAAGITFGTGSDIVLKFDGTQLEFLPVSDDAAAINIGDGTTDVDFKVFLGAAGAYVEFNVGTGQLNVEGAEVHLGDSDEIEFGDATAGDVTMQWNGTDFAVAGAAVGAIMRLNKVSIVQYEITDVVNGALPVTDSGFVNIVSTGAETNTVAIPNAEGLELTLNMLTDGGNRVVTVASAINATGNNTITFADTSDFIRLLSIDKGGTLAWRILAQDGVALSTV